MSRPLLAALVTLVLTAAGSAQLPPVQLTVDPAPEPKPALRYSLLPTGRERVGGNAALHYAKAALARPAVDRGAQPELEKKLVGWEQAECDTLPAEEVRAVLKGYATAFRELEHGSRCKACEWDFAPASGPDTINDLVAVIPAYRDLARMLALRVRMELAEKRYEDAVGSIRTGLQFAKHLGEGPTLIQCLVGHAVAAVFVAKAEEFVARPGSPSLYWAVSTLPRPFIDPRPALDGEDELIDRFIPGLADLRKGPVAADKALDAAEAAAKVLAEASGGPDPFAAFGGRVALAGYAALHHDEAKKELAARGWEKKAVDAMPAVQAVFLNTFEAYRELADDHRKWFLVPLPEGFDGLAKAVAKGKKIQKDRKGETLFQAFALLLPATEKVYQAGARTERKLAALRAVEAVRVHAHAAAGLPKALADLKRVPVPDDPLTGQPFVYTVTPEGFTLRSPESEGVPKAVAVSYEVKVRK
jgi:hypothetical protein